MIRRLSAAVLGLALVWSVPATQAGSRVEELLEEARIASGDGRFGAQAFFGDTPDPLDLVPSGPRGPSAAGWTLGRDSGDPSRPGGLTVQIIDGCPVNGRVWVFAAGSGADAVRLVITDLATGTSVEHSFPGPPGGEPLGTLFDPDAFATCGQGPDTWLPAPELPALEGEAVFRPVAGRCPDFVTPLSIAQSGPGRAYDRLVFRGEQVNPIVSLDPVAAADGSRSYDERIALLAGEDPGAIEGLVLSGAQGRLPAPRAFAHRVMRLGRDGLAAALDRTRRGRLPRDVRTQLGAGRAACTYHVAIELDGPDYDPGQARALLVESGWRLEPLDPAPSDRFMVEVSSGDGPGQPLVALPPLPASGPLGPTLLFRGAEAMVGVVDACALDERYWVIGAGPGGATASGGPVELAVRDSTSGEVMSYPLGAAVGPATPAIVDTSAFATCP